MSIQNYKKNHSSGSSAIHGIVNRMHSLTRRSTVSRLGLTEDLSEIESETASVNINAMNSLSLTNSTAIVARLSQAYRRKLALQSRIPVTTGGVLPCLFFNS